MASNLNKSITFPTGVGSFTDPAACLIWDKEKYNSSSWFYTGHFNANGEVLDFLWHFSVSPNPKGPTAHNIMTITNETTGVFLVDDCFCPLAQSEKNDGYSYETSKGWVHGTLDKMELDGTLKDGQGKIEMKITGQGPVIFNGGTGEFPMLNMHVYQYSMPGLLGQGKITLDGHVYEVEGPVWFDRQWQQMSEEPSGKTGTPLTNLQWGWMSVNLETGEHLSIWAAPDGSVQRGWATIAHTDGSQSVVASDPTFSPSAMWKSSYTGVSYPTHFNVAIPAMDSTLVVDSCPKNQERASVIPELSIYEGATRVTGTWHGAPTNGYGVVELVGKWS